MQTLQAKKKYHIPSHDCVSTEKKNIKSCKTKLYFVCGWKQFTNRNADEIIEIIFCNLSNYDK